jgi:hypothetical protein
MMKVREIGHEKEVGPVASVFVVIGRAVIAVVFLGALAVIVGPCLVGIWNG